MIPGSKPFLKKILENDYNANIEPKEPKKPNSLNNFLQFRKEMMKNNKFYQDLPLQEGLFEPDPEDARQNNLQAKAKTIQENLDFKLLDADEDVEKAKNSTATSLDEEDEVMDTFEQNMVKREGDIFEKKEANYIQGFGIVGYG